MAASPQPDPSFSAAQRWRIALNVCLSTLAVLAVVVMANYLSRDWFFRFRCSSHAGAELSPLTLKLVRSITNTVKVTLFYDRDEPLFSTIADLLKQYQLANRRIIVQAVDYNRDPGAGLKVRQTYKDLATGQKDVIIFDCGGRPLIFPGRELTKAVIERVPNEKERTFRRKLTEFEGERVCTSYLIAVTNPTRPKVYFLQDHHGEHPLQSQDVRGYLEFVTVLHQNNIEVETLNLLGTNAVPADCRLLIIAGIQTPLMDMERDKIDQYLNQGGRLLALFNSYAMDPRTGVVPPCGLESILAKWGVEVGANVILDPQHSPGKGFDIVVSDFNVAHPVANPLVQQGLYMMEPRSVSRINTRLQTPDALKVEEIAFTGTNAFAASDPAHQRSFPVIAAVDATIKGVTTERGSIRLLVAGDSFFLDNEHIVSLDNRGFVGYAVNWLLDRFELIGAIGPRPVQEYRVLMTRTQMQTTQLLLMAVLPGAIVLLGGLVWLRRRR